MLAAIEHIRPLGSNDWERVASMYNENIPVDFTLRGAESIKRKFLIMKNEPKPTGDPSYPKAVVRAKRAYYAMECRASVESFGDDVHEAPPSSSTRSDRASCGSVASPSSQAEHAEPGSKPSTNDDVTTPPEPRAATQRCGKTPEQLVQLSAELKRRAHDLDESVTVSQTAKRRREIDSMLEHWEQSESSSVSDMAQLILALEERAAVRELALRREREEAEARREEREAKREEREAKREELFLVLMSKLVGKPNI
ncbi:hypothetical protein PHYBOEH_007375 [Phytophthora boehmeriae]|uniref:DUF6818 domain-containing protein n=1 Tax=Phytophthora boehmeriae TaxID=109152 RepID=A0A8T1WAF6_9STRA|nr:hypothetical protein PHYBOEH_007375 [Phytophthora boehmeriae]